MAILNKAIYLGWNGYIDTQVKFSQFFGQDHTVMAWFMPQYPYAYAGPLFSDNSRISGKYIIGQARYDRGDGGYKDPGSPVFMVQMENVDALYLVPGFKANKWQHIAVVRQNDRFKLYINGVYKAPVQIVSRKIVGMGIAGSNDHVYVWYQAAKNTVSSGSSTDLDVYRLPYAYTLPPGKKAEDVVDCAIAGSNDHVYAWFKDGTVCSGTTGDLDKYQKPYAYKLPPGKSPENIVGIGIAGSNDRVYAWYDDGTVSSGTSGDLDKHKAPSPYSLPAEKTPLNIVGIDIASNDRVYAWYDDGTVSSGTSGDLDKYQKPVKYTQPLKGADIINPGTDLEVSSSFMPAGTLRFGRSGKLKNKWQAYGLLDDAAIFDRALSGAEIKAIYQKKKLTGSEAGLLAGWGFDESKGSGPSVPSTLKTWHDRSERAYPVAVSANRNSKFDAKSFENPEVIGETQITLRLPFHSDEIWQVIQGYNDLGGSHNSNSAFSWDFKLADKPQTGEYPLGTAHAPVYASGLGQAAAYLPDGPLVDGREPNFVTLKIGKGEYLTYLHLAANSLAKNITGGSWDDEAKGFVLADGKGDWIGYGSFVAELGPGAAHLHLAAANDVEDSVTIPIAFSTYEVYDEADKQWVAVTRGVPQAGQRIQHHLSSSPVRYTAAWQPSTEGEIQVYGWKYEDFRTKYDELWSKGWRLKLLNVYVVSGQVRYTAAWQPSTEGEIQVYGWKYEDFRTKYDQLWEEGWRLKLLAIYVVNGQVRYTAAWQPSTEGEIQVYGWKYKDYRARYDELWSKGWRLKLLNVYVVSGQPRYTAVWRPSTEGELQVYGWKYKDYRAKYDQLWDQGWRLKSLNVYVIKGQVRYTAVWKPGMASEIQVYGWTYEDFRARYDLLWEQGWRLKLLDIYTI